MREGGRCGGGDMEKRVEPQHTGRTCGLSDCLFLSLGVQDPQRQTWFDQDRRPGLAGHEEDPRFGPHRADCTLRRPRLGPEEEQGREAEGSRSAVGAH